MGIVGVREPDKVATVMSYDRALFGARIERHTLQSSENDLRFPVAGVILRP